MIPEFEGRIALRLSTCEREQVDKLVENGKFESISQVIRAALDDFLAKQ
jgi:Arc/MetJ-type ribon-helix-helix transcriptional regulator